MTAEKTSPGRRQPGDQEQPASVTGPVQPTPTVPAAAVPPRRSTSAPIRRDTFMPKPADLPTEASGHLPIVRKLANEILPWLVSAEELRKKPLYRAHRAYSWTRDTLAGLTGFGLSHPLAKAISGESTDLGAALAKMPFWLCFVTGFAAVAWVILKAYVTRDDGEKRAMLAASCRKEFMSLNLKLRNVLQNPRPIKGLVAIQAEVAAIVDRHIAEGSWAFENDDILAPGIHEKVRQRTAELVTQHLSSWEEASQEGDVERVEADRIRGDRRNP